MVHSTRSIYRNDAPILGESLASQGSCFKKKQSLDESLTDFRLFSKRQNRGLELGAPAKMTLFFLNLGQKPAKLTNR